MEPLTARALALVTLLLNKTVEKTGEIIVAKAFEKAGNVIKLLKHKSPDTANALKAAVQNAALPPGQREDIGVTVPIWYGDALSIRNIKNSVPFCHFVFPCPRIIVRTIAQESIGIRTCLC